MKDFIIPFRGLSLGPHRYNWEIGKRFFESFENPEIEDAKISVGMELEKQERMMILNFMIRGEITVLCDRCQEELELNVNVVEIYYVKFGDVESQTEEDNNILIIPENEFKIDIASLVNEFITLSLPIRKVHGDEEDGKSKCNPIFILRVFGGIT